MTKADTTLKTTRARPTSAYRPLGTLADGVVVLQPKVKPTHFTNSEIRKTIKKILDTNTDDC